MRFSPAHETRARVALEVLGTAYDDIVWGSDGQAFGAASWLTEGATTPDDNALTAHGAFRFLLPEGADVPAACRSLLAAARDRRGMVRPDPTDMPRITAVALVIREARLPTLSRP